MARAPGESTLLRLNRAIAMAGICSRRKADELIQAGRVAVNGEIVAEPGRRIDPRSDRVMVNGDPIAVPLPDAGHAYYLLHKPIETVTTASDPQGRTTVLDLLPQDIREKRPVPVGRLDYFSEGLLVLTTDGDLTHRMTHPSHHMDKVYEVKVRGDLGKRELNVMRSGMRLKEGEKLAPVQAEVLWAKGKSSLLRLVLGQGVNRQIRRMCRDLDLTVLKLKRVSQGPLSLGDLPPGKWRPLSKAEIRKLRRAVDLPA